MMSFSTEDKEPSDTEKHLKLIKLAVSKPVSRHYFKKLHPIGRGSIGMVWKVQSKRSKKLYALKEMDKQRVVMRKSVKSVMNERQILSKLRHEFIVNMKYSFEDRHSLYLVLDLMPGGDLRSFMHKQVLSEYQCKFLVACICEALEYIHSKDIVHRDVKPENLVFSESAYIRLTDFGIARRANSLTDNSGTPGYMAPEVLCRMNHGPPADFFALGVILYEILKGRRPYLGRNRTEIRDAVLCRQAALKESHLPLHWQPTAASFVNSLLMRKPSERMQNLQAVKAHPWMKDFSWEALRKQTLMSPFIVRPKDGTECTLEWPDTLLDVMVDHSLFEGFYYEVSKKKNFILLYE